MSFTSRLLRMASLLLAVFAGQSSYAFNITTPVTGPVDTSTTGGVLNEDGDHTVSNEGSVTVDGTPAAPGAVVIIDHSDTRNVVIDGPITVNDRSEDEITDFDANNAIGVLVGDGAPVSGDITFGSLSHITLVDDKPLADEDGDEYVDGIYNDSGVYVAGSFAQDDGRIGRLDALGILGQMMWTNIDEGNGALSDAHAEMFGLGAYAAENFGPVLWNLNATVGIGSMRSERTVTVSSVSDLLSADWDGTQYAVSTGLQVPMLKGAHKLQAEISGDYYRLDHDNFSETETYNSGLAMQVENGNSSLASASIGLRGQYDVATRARDDISVVPSYFLGYRSIVAHDRYQADVSFVGGGERFTVMSQDMPEDRAIIGVSLAANNPYFALEVGSRSEFGGDTEIISGGASLRVNF